MNSLFPLPPQLRTGLTLHTRWMTWILIVAQRPVAAFGVIEERR